MAEGLWDKIERLWTWLRSSPTQRSTDLVIDSSHVDPADRLPTPIRRNDSYFEVVVKEMFLAFDREWFKVYQPIVLVSSSFQYDKGTKEVPFVVGPSQLGKSIEAPRGVLIKNTRVAGPFPYRGDRLALSIILGKTEHTDYAKKVLDLIASVATVIPPATALTGHLKVAGSILDSVEMILKMRSQEALVGLRKELTPGAGDAGTLPSSYFALINLPENNVKPEEIFVKNGGLAVGKTLDQATPFREADFVLYAVQAVPRREDERALPFYDFWNQALAAAGRPDDESWKLAKTSLASLYVAMVQSPDLISAHVAELIEKFKTDLKEAHNAAQALETLGPAVSGDARWKALDQILSQPDLFSADAVLDKLLTAISTGPKPKGEMETLGAGPALPETDESRMVASIMEM